MPPYHPIFGHFIALKECIQQLPRDTTMHVIVRHMAKEFPNGIFYLNLWPFNNTIMVVADPSAASKIETVKIRGRTPHTFCVYKQCLVPVLKGLSLKYGIQRVTLLSLRHSTVVLKVSLITLLCNRRCPYCISPGPLGVPRQRTLFLSLIVTSFS